jgi:aryl-alcohol dehydrogenase-like predicted oxidoreductase
MKYRTFGRMNWQVSEIGFGAWAIGGDAWGPQKDEDSLQALRLALDLGVNFIDTAQGYGNGHSEELIGKILKERGEKIGAGNIKIATKIPPTPGNWPPFPEDRIQERFPEAYLRDRLEFSLKKLQAETIDVLQLHTWTRAWNEDPVALHILQKFKQEGKILAAGVSTPEHDQNCLIDLMRDGLLDAVQVIYNIFEQEPAAEFLPTAQQNNVGVIIRVVFDEGSLTGKFKEDTEFPKGDFRRAYFKGERLKDTVDRVNKVRKTITKHKQDPDDLASIAIRFVLQHAATSTVIPGIRNVHQAKINCAVSDQPVLNNALYEDLKRHNWRRAFWYAG